MTNNTTANTITILKTTERGAHLITDGVRVAWIMGRCLRADGSLTPSGITALEEGKPYDEWKAEEERRNLSKEEKYRLWQEEQKKPSVIPVSANRVQDYSEKAWKVRTANVRKLYGRWVPVYEYLPKSLVSVRFIGAVAEITLPKWFLAKNGWLDGITSVA